MASRREFLVSAAVAALTIGSVGGIAPALAQNEADPLVAGFRDPPRRARPRVWWHWMNGNITEDGIAKDLDWMSRVGIGGLQNFDADLMTPQIVKQRLAYMTPEWKKAFRFAAARAEEKGLELAIAGSPGWSETGGPWVQPEDGIKKVSWSETIVAGGRRFTGRLAMPPTTTGPFQTMPGADAFRPAREGGAAPSAYRDIATLAIPLASVETSADAVVEDGNGRVLDGALLIDGNLEKTVDLGVGTPAQPVMMTLRYGEPREKRSATLFVHDAQPAFGDPYFTPVLEARVDGSWRRIATFDTAPVPTTIAFSPVRAAEFRVVFGPYAGPSRPAMAALAPGVVIPPLFAPGPSSPSIKVAEFRLFDEARIDRFEAKAGFALVNDYHALKTSASEGDEGPAVVGVIDLTKRMRSDGTLDWIPPAGHWRVIRMGWTLTGKTNHPASPEATGLEVDKLDGEAVARYLRHYLDMYQATTGDDLFGSRGVRALLLDSTEVGSFNWTPRLIEQFRKLRGYDPTPWLATLVGVVIGSRAESDRFLYDFRRTLSDLHATEHYATVARVAHEYGLRLYNEALEDQRPVLGDDMAMRRYADVPMAALWTWNDKSGPRPTLLGDMKGASSVAHIYGRDFVAAESMTSALAPWADAPSTLRRVIDLEFAHGVNRPVIHTSVHQPLDDKQPGLSLMIFGQFFNRHESWAEMARPWIDYISRSAFLLQQGRNVADVAYFYGEDAPITVIAAFGPPKGLPARYAYDYVNASVLSDVLTVEDRDLVAPSGVRYRVLYLGVGADRMTLPTLRRIASLVADGATIVGKPPASSPSLADDAGEYADLVKRLWGGGEVTKVGKGRVFGTPDVEAALVQIGVMSDLDLNDAAAAKDIMFVHRQLDDGDLYFVVNRAKQARSLNAQFRVVGKAPDFWHADTGAVTPASYRSDDAVTTVPLELGPEESVFILFRTDAVAPARTVRAPDLATVLDVVGPWEVALQNGRGAPPSIKLTSLGSLSDQADPGVRYFSGEAVYTARFTLPPDVKPGAPLRLDLGKVGDLAEVKVNGKEAGSVWHAPYRVDVSGLVQTGENLLEIKVANRWINRLIGDAQPGAEKVTFTTIPTYKPDAPLRPSGLIGPVRLSVARG